MKEQKNLKAIMLEQVQEKAQNIGSHLDIVTLADYLDGLLEEREAEVIREHLTICGHCRNELLSLENCDDISDEILEQDHGRKSNRKGLWLTLPRRVSFAYGVAAMVLLAWLLSYNNFSPRNALPNPDQAFLSPLQNGTTRETEIPREIRIEPGSPGLFLTLNLTNMSEYSSYQLEIYPGSRSENPLYKIENLERKSSGNFTVFIPKEMLQTGPSWFVINGINETETNEIAAYRANVEFP